MIPKIIWQTHESEYNSLPKHLLAISMTWRNLNPTWEYRYVNAKEREKQVKELSSDLYKLYPLANNVNKSDLWRYAVTLEYGGVYADLDSICTMPLDYFISKHWSGQEAISTSLGYQTYNKKMVNNSNFAAVRQSKVLKDVHSYINTHYKLYEDFITKNHISSGEAPSFYFYHAHAAFTYSVQINKDIVCPGFESVIMHSSELKEEFSSDYLIDYCGVEETYHRLSIKNGWKTYIDALDNDKHPYSLSEENQR
jgi:hypothetical protein